MGKWADQVAEGEVHPQEGVLRSNETAILRSKILVPYEELRPAHKATQMEDSIRSTANRLANRRLDKSASPACIPLSACANISQQETGCSWRQLRQRPCLTIIHSQISHRNQRTMQRLQHAQWPA